MHAAILHNTRTGRFHPMPFRASPRPSDDVEPGKPCRHRSIGHHTEGFPTEDAARVFIAQSGWTAFGVHDWDGTGMPATTVDLVLFPDK